MGHKVHPTGIRLGIAKDWNSKWYAGKKEYAEYLAADLKVREMLRKKLAAAGISKILIERPAKTARVTVHTAQHPLDLDACVAYAEACDAYEAAAARSAAARRAGERGWPRLNTCAMEAHARMDAALRALGAAAREAVLGS